MVNNTIAVLNSCTGGICHLYISSFLTMTKFILVLVCCVLVGCGSAKKAISESSMSIYERAGSSLEASTEIYKLALSDVALDAAKASPQFVNAHDQIQTLALRITTDQQSIQSNVNSIQSNLTRVEDTTPWWARMTSNLAVAGIVIGIIILLWQTGLGMLVKKIVWSLGMFIPKNTMRSAEADLKMLDSDNAMAQREAVAIRRTSDPAYEAARKKLKQRNNT